VEGLDELQDATRLQGGRSLDLHLARTNLVALTQRVVLQYEDRPEKARFHVESSTPAIYGHWDEMRLERVLANLLSNAPKYSPRTCDIRVRVARDGQRAVLSVEDRGIGIPAADVPHIFERYRRGSNVAQLTRGSGLGLAGVRAIVEQHGGTISVRSIEGDGSTFVVVLPLAV
jgi:signal transduction histidine kinase